MTLKDNIKGARAIDEKGHFLHAVKPKKKVTLIFENGSIVQIDESNDKIKWEGVIGLMFETWLSLEEVKK